MRVGILGGSFDPIHNGHIELARFVLDNCLVFDEIWLTPSFNPSFDKNPVGYGHRLSMCQLAVQGYRRIIASNIECILEPKNTNQLFNKLKAYPYSIITFYMIIGMDEALQIQSWVNWEELTSNNSFVVVDRVGFKPTKKKLWFQSAPHVYLKDTYGVIPVASSTTIRNKSEFISNLLRPTVLKYMLENKLYE